MATERDLSQLVINKLTKSQFNSATKDPDQLYFVTDDDSFESSSNKVTSISSSSTDTQYPSAKAVYTAIQSVPTGEQMHMDISSASTPSSINLPAGATRTYVTYTSSTRTSVTINKISSNITNGVEHYILFKNTSSSNDCQLVFSTGVTAPVEDWYVSPGGAVEISYIYINNVPIITYSMDLETK